MRRSCRRALADARQEGLGRVVELGRVAEGRQHQLNVSRVTASSSTTATTFGRFAIVNAPGREQRAGSDAVDRNGEHISHAALGLDDARRAGIAFELAPQAKNLHVDAAIEDVLVHARGL